jgi:phosphatidylcholine synthase
MEHDSERPAGSRTPTPARAAAAFAVHVFTALGAMLGLFALIAAFDGRWNDMFMWLGIALVVDGVDGPLARWIRVADVLPRWSGDVLDLVVDYVTYILVPAVAIANAGLVAQPFAMAAAIAVVMSGAIYYADTRMKSEDDYFRGFPAFWNLVVFYLFLVRPDPTIALVAVAVFVVLTFVPVHFVHPFRTKKWMGFNMTLVASWTALAVLALMYGMDPPAGVTIVLLAIGIYYLLAGLARPRRASD